MHEPRKCDGKTSFPEFGLVSRCKARDWQDIRSRTWLRRSLLCLGVTVVLVWVNLLPTGRSITLDSPTVACNNRVRASTEEGCRTGHMTPTNKPKQTRSASAQAGTRRRNFAICTSDERDSSIHGWRLLDPRRARTSPYQAYWCRLPVPSRRYLTGRLDPRSLQEGIPNMSLSSLDQWLVGPNKTCQARRAHVCLQAGFVGKKCIPCTAPVRR